MIRKFLDAVGEHMEFGQLQLNYLDWDFQQARDKAAELNRRNIPIWVMEPLRGGRLARLTDEEAEELRALRPGESPVGWAFRFLQGVPGVTVILSGMSNQEQLEANLDTFETDKPLTDAERSALLDIAGGMVNGQVLPCTACRSTPSPAAASSPPWRWAPCPRTSGPPPASAAAAASGCAPSS